MRVDLELKHQAGSSDLGNAGVNFEDLVKLGGRFEFHRRACQHRVHTKRKQILPFEANSSKVFGPSDVVIGQIVRVEDDGLEISVGKTDPDIVMEFEEGLHEPNNALWSFCLSIGAPV